MNQKTQSKSSTLGAKLKKAVQHLQVDVFGYEPKVTKNVLTYFSELSRTTKIPKERLFLRMFDDGESVRTVVYYQGRLIKKISVKELITIFTGVTLHMESQVTHKMQAFMQEVAAKHHITTTELQLCIVTDREKVWVRAYDRTRFLTVVPLKELVKHFIG